jgi:hypothetical protein
VGQGKVEVTVAFGKEEEKRQKNLPLRSHRPQEASGKWEPSRILEEAGDTT